MKLVKVKDLQVNTDDRGHLFEVVHDYDIEKFGQAYIVHNPCRGTIRAFHKHEKLWDYFCIVKGSAKFAFAKDDIVEVITISEKAPKMIIVPPGVYHGWMSLEDDTILLSVGSELYNKENPDEERIAYDSFNKLYGNDIWKITRK